MNTRDMLTISAGFLAGIQAASLWYWGSADDDQVESDQSTSPAGSPRRHRSKSETCAVTVSDTDGFLRPEARKLAQSAENLSSSSDPPSITVSSYQALDSSALPQYLTSTGSSLTLVEEDIPSPWPSCDQLIDTASTMGASVDEIHRLGSMLCEGLQPSRPSSADPTSSETNSYTTKAVKSTTALSRPEDQGTRAKSAPNGLLCDDDYERRSQSATQLFSTESEDDNRMFSASEHYSMATSSDHLYCSPDFFNSDVEFVSVAGEDHPAGSGLLSNTPTHTDRLTVYTPYTHEEEEHDLTPATSSHSFQNIITSVSELEESLGPEKNSDLRFLRTILENDQLSALHKAVQRGKRDQRFSQSVPHLNQPILEDDKLRMARSANLTVSNQPVCRWEELTEALGAYENEDDLVTIRFEKPANVTLGATIIEDKHTGDIRIRRVLEESPIAACNKIHAGDIIKRINDVPVSGMSLNDVCELLARQTHGCTLTVSTFGEFSERQEHTKSHYYRAFFNYDPRKDVQNPCRDASFSFSLGDILEVVNTDDGKWWQAKKYGTSSVGLVPSAEQRLQYLTSKSAKAAAESPLYKREQHQKKRKDFLFAFGEKEYKEPLTYIEVTHVRPSKTKRRPIIITGAKGFGGSCLRKKILQEFPNKYFLPTKHTTKPGMEPSFTVCSKKEFQAMIKADKFIEYSKFGGYYYGTSFQSVVELIVSGRVCLLDVHPQYLSHLCTGTLRPHVIYVEPATEERIKDLKHNQPESLPASQRKIHGNEIRELRFNSERLLRRYTEYVDTIITLESLAYAVDLIDQVTDRIISQPTWIPKKWLQTT